MKTIKMIIKNTIRNITSIKKIKKHCLNILDMYGHCVWAQHNILPV